MRYHDISHDNMNNGDGLRVVLWVSGCSNHCPECQNPSTWDHNDGLIFDGYAWEEIEDQLEEDFIEGITFSGGDPLFKANREDITHLAKLIKDCYPEKTIWLYTGYVYEDISELEIMEYIDVLIDGPYVDKMRDTTLKWRGSSNQRVIDIKKTRELGQIVLWCD